MAPAARHPRAGARAGAGPVTAPLAAADAARRILDEVRRQPALRVPLDDALDSVLAEDIVSPLDIPAWTNSAMDGYAARGDGRARRLARSGRCGSAWSSSCPPGASPPGRSGRARAPGSSPARRCPTAPTPSSARRTPTTAPRPSPSCSDRDVGVQHPAGGRGHPAGRDGAHGGDAARAGAARRARLARGGAPAGLPAAPGRHPGQRRRDRGRGPARGDPERAEDREQQHPHAAWRWCARPAGSRSTSASPATRPTACASTSAGALDCDLLVTTRRHQCGRARLRALGARGAGGGAAVLAHPHAAGRAGGVRPAWAASPGSACPGTR